MKKIIAMLLALTMVLGLAACGGSTAPAATEAPAAAAPAATEAPAAAPAGGEPVKLDVIISQYGNYTQAWWTEFEKNFEAANEGIDLNIEIVSWNDIYSVVTTRISNNGQPDMLNISGFADYVADDLLMPATEYTSAALQANFIDSFWASNEMDGTVWALPILASCRSLFVNTDLLTEAGVAAAPTT